MPEALPKLRSNLRADNYLLDGETKNVVVTDVLLRREDNSPKLKLPYELWEIALLMDGQSDAETIQQHASRWKWIDVSMDMVHRATSELDKYYLLDNSRYQQRLQKIGENLSRQPFRQTIAHSHFFAPEPKQLTSQLENCYLSPFGPGQLPSATTDGVTQNVRGAIVPHAHYDVSGPCAAWAYHKIARSHAFDLFVVIGYNHIYAENRIETLVKDVSSPFGKISVDTDFAQALLARSSGSLEEGGIANYYEHSIDMQIPMLQYMLHQTGRKAKILPIILSNVPKAGHIDAVMGFRQTMSAVGDAVRETIAEQGKRACIIASGDFTHCGPYYGDPEPDSTTMSELGRFDKSSIDLILNDHRDDFYKRTVDTKYCCVTPVYLLLSCLERPFQAQLLKYYTSWDIVGQRRDVNSFASIVFC